VKPLEVYQRAVALGLKLKPKGDRLLVYGDRCPADFADELRQHKREILALLERQTCGLPADQAAWLHTARQILAGEFDGCDRSTRESLTIGLRAVEHPLCRRALERLGIPARRETHQ
jgi:hypothetical protein